MTGFGLSTIELSALIALCKAGKSELTVSELAEAMRDSASVASRAVKGLEAKQFVASERTRRKVVSFSNSAHAVAFQALLNLHSHVDFVSVLSHSCLRVLSAFAGLPCSVDKMARVSRLPEVTVRRFVSTLLERGLMVRRARGEYCIALTGLQEFVQAFVEFGARRRARVGGLICAGPNCLVRTDKALPSGFALTGISVFHEYGVQVVLPVYRDYWFNLFDEKLRRPSLEEAVVHALARSTILSSGREASYALLVMFKNWNKLDRRKLLQVAGDLNVLTATEQSISFVENFISKGKLSEPLVQGFATREGLPFLSVEEFTELVKQYA